MHPQGLMCDTSLRALDLFTCLRSLNLSDNKIADMMERFLAFIVASILGCAIQDEMPMVRGYLQAGGHYVENAAG